MGPPKSSGKGGSTFKRLKTDLKSAGVIGVKTKKKIAKAAPGGSHRANVLKDRADAVLRSLRVNPFESKVNRTKHDVLGRKLKGSSGRPGLTRQKGLDARKHAIMGDLARRNKAGGIVDQRIGERNPALTEEEKNMLRWTMAKQKEVKSKKKSFNLEDDDKFGGLTHLGKSLDDLDNFDDLGDYDEDLDGVLSKEFVMQGHFGGGDQATGGHKSKADVMKELIAKAKSHKAERQRIRQENEDLREQLDGELDGIRGLLMDKRAAGAAGAAGDTSRVDGGDGPEDDAFDQIVRELKFDKRARPTDRTKTEEELALEEKERLEKLERDRLRRMNGELAESDDESRRKATGRRRRKRAEAVEFESEEDESSDDDEAPALTYGEDGGLINNEIFIRSRKAAGASSDEEDSEEDEEEDSEEGEDESDDESGSEEEEDLAPSEGKKPAHLEADNDEDGASEVSDLFSDDYREDSDLEGHQESKEVDGKFEISEEERTAMMQKAQQELPYVFPIPLSQAEFDELMVDRTPDQVLTLVERMRKLYHPSLGAGNKEKLAAAFSFLLGYLWNSPDASAKPLFTTLYPVLVDMAKAHTLSLGQWASDVLGSLVTETSVPTHFAAGQLFSFKFLINVFPTSDFYHAIITPLLMAFTAYLSRPAKSISDASIGLFVTAMAIETQARSKRWMPEVFNYITRLIAIYSSSASGYFPSEGLLCPDRLDSAPSPLSLETVARRKSRNEHSSLLMAALTQIELLDGLFSEKLISLPEIYDPLLEMIRGLPESTASYSSTSANGAPAKSKASNSKQKSLGAATAHADLVTKRSALLSKLEANRARSLQRRSALQLQKHRPVAIASIDPDFEDHYSLDRKYKDQGDKEAEKMRTAYKKERKGAIRELRRDAEFLATVRAKEQKRKDREYDSKMKRIMGSLGDELGELNKMKREAKRLKKT